MMPDFESCYRAVRSRDVRFDGRFFTAVVSTGIYCRPVCPAPTPPAANVRFYACAAAAEAAGFRACRRCCPESAPGAPDWNLRADLAARALRLIAEGTVDAEGVGGLARRLAVSEQHLHRILMTEVGAGPLALARTRRAQTARLLIDQTHLPLTTVSGIAGFSSMRQFNDTMQAVFGRTPTGLRTGATPASGAGDLALRLQYWPPFDGEWMLSYLALHAIAGVEEVREGCYRRSLALGGSRGILELEPVAGNAVMLRVQLDDLGALPAILQRCRQLFDLDAEPLAINAVLGGDPILAPLVAARPGLRVPGAVDGFELAVRAILGQMVSVAAARTFGRRLVETAGSPLLEPRGALTHLFPTAERIAEADLDPIGITRSRVVALRALANAVAAGTIVLDRGAEWQETIARLQALPGIGPWTASYIAMRALGDPDAYPIGDLGLRRALERQGMAIDNPSVAARAEAWRPWRAYAVHHLWSTLPALQPGAVASGPRADPRRSDIRKPPAPRAAAR